jgi:hypothetical protein
MTLKVVKSPDLIKGGSTLVFPGKNRKVALSIHIQGVLKDNIAMKINKTHLEKIKTSPWNTPESYLAKSPIKLIPKSTPIRRTIISEIGYNHFISEEGIPDSIASMGKKGKFIWSKYNWLQRLEYHLGELAEGNSFTYEIL